jgi:phage tail-like protein
MATTKDQIAATYPLPVYNYRVQIGADTIAFAEVSGLSIGFETTTYKESQTASGMAGPRTFHMPAQCTPTKVTLKKGVVRQASVKTLYGWISGVRTNRVDKKDIAVDLCDESGAAVIRWTVHNAFPTKLDAPTFDAKSNDAAIEQMELTADSIDIAEV